MKRKPGTFPLSPCGWASAGLAIAAAGTAWAQEPAPGTDPAPVLQLPLTTLTPNPRPLRFDLPDAGGTLYAKGTQVRGLVELGLLFRAQPRRPAQRPDYFP